MMRKKHITKTGVQLYILGGKVAIIIIGPAPGWDSTSRNVSSGSHLRICLLVQTYTTRWQGWTSLGEQRVYYFSTIKRNNIIVIYLKNWTYEKLRRRNGRKLKHRLIANIYYFHSSDCLGHTQINIHSDSSTHHRVWSKTWFPEWSPQLLVVPGCCWWSPGEELEAALEWRRTLCGREWKRKWGAPNMRV